MKSVLFENIYVEEEALNYQLTKRILAKLNKKENYKTIENYDEYFSRIEKPYWHRSGNLNLFLAVKKGDVIKNAPPAYGVPFKQIKHYYFVHAYNCIYACHYCYLQGYFRSSDIVIFVNRKDILHTVKEIALANAKKNITSYFYSGEFSDSLALAEISEETSEYLPFFASLQNTARLELRTKSVAIRSLQKYAQQNKHMAPQNVVVAYSLSSQEAAMQYDEKAPSIAARLKAIAKLLECGYAMAFHLDPIVLEENEKTMLQNYQKLLTNLGELLIKRPQQLAYISLGMLRFSKESLKKAKKNHYFSPLWQNTLVSQKEDFDNKKRYKKETRIRIFTELEAMAAKSGIDVSKIYRCMEEN